MLRMLGMNADGSGRQDGLDVTDLASDFFRLLQTGIAAYTSKTAGAFGQDYGDMVCVRVVGNAHPAVAIPMERGQLGHHHVAVRERWSLMTGPLWNRTHLCRRASPCQPTLTGGSGLPCCLPWWAAGLWPDSTKPLAFLTANRMHATTTANCTFLTRKAITCRWRMAQRVASVSDKWQALHALNFACQTETSRWRTVKDLVPLPHVSSTFSRDLGSTSVSPRMDCWCCADFPLPSAHAVLRHGMRTCSTRTGVTSG